MWSWLIPRWVNECEVDKGTNRYWSWGKREGEPELGIKIRHRDRGEGNLQISGVIDNHERTIGQQQTTHEKVTQNNKKRHVVLDLTEWKSFPQGWLWSGYQWHIIIIVETNVSLWLESGQHWVICRNCGPQWCQMARHPRPQAGNTWLDKIRNAN